MFMVVEQAVGWWGGDRSPLGLWDSLWWAHHELFLTLLLHLLSASFTRQGKSRLPGGYFKAFIMGRIFILQHPQSQILQVCGANQPSEK